MSNKELGMAARGLGPLADYSKTNKPSSTDERCSFCNYPHPAHSDICQIYHARQEARPVGDLVARLRHTRIVTLNGQSGPVPLNPDGPEAADLITDLQTRLERYREAAEYAHGVLTTTNRFDPAQCDEAAEALGKALSDGEG